MEKKREGGGLAFWRGSVIASAVLYELVGLMALAGGARHLRALAVALAVMFMGVCLYCGQIRRYSSSAIRAGLSIFLVLFIPLFAMVSMLLFGAVAVAIGLSDAAVRFVAWGGAAVLILSNVLSLIGLSRIGKVYEAERRQRRTEARRHRLQNAD